MGEKIRRGEKLDGEDRIRMMTLPLTVKGTEGKQEVILKTVALTQKMRDHHEAVEVLAGLLTFTDKIIDESYRQRIEEEIEMTQIGKMIFDKGLKEGIGQGISQGITQGTDRKLIDQCCRKLRKEKTPARIAEDLEEPVEVIGIICRAAESFAPDYDEERVYRAWIKITKGTQNS